MSMVIEYALQKYLLEKRKEKQAPKQPSWIKQTLNMCLLCII